MRASITHERNTRWLAIIAGLGCACASNVNAAVPAAQATLQPDGRAPAGAHPTMAVPGFTVGSTVHVEIRDPHGHPVWFGATREATVTFPTDAWADGDYTVRFKPGGEVRFRVDSEYFAAIRARCGLLMRELDAKRDADGQPPKALWGASNLLQRVMTLFVWTLPKPDVDGHLYFCEKQIGFRTATGTARLLGSGSSDFTGYDGPYQPGLRERSSLFVPPHTVVDFAEHGARKLKRWGYGSEDVEHLFISHSHGDHFHEGAIVDFADARHAAGLKPLIVHAGKASCDRLRAELENRKTADRAVIDELTPFKEVRAGELEVKPVVANHDPAAGSMCFILRYRGATMFYGTDTGSPLKETYDALAAERFDLFVHELTIISADDGIGHMDLGDFQLLVGRLRADGALTPWSRVVTMHQAPEGPPYYQDIAHYQRSIGFDMGYDGMPLPIAFRSEEKPDQER